MPDTDAVDDATADLDDEFTDRTGKKSPREAGPLDRRIAETIIRLRNQRDLTQEELANLVVPADPRETWSKVRVQRLEKAYRRATVTELDELIAALGTTPAQFYAEAGVIQLPNDTLSHLRVDLSLLDGYRQSLITMYESLRQASRTS